jgi:hypothetical protein
VLERYRRVCVVFDNLGVGGRVGVAVTAAAAGARRGPDGIDDETKPAGAGARNLGKRRMLVCGGKNSIGGALVLVVLSCRDREHQ